jgi:hypothetical protein
MFASTKDFPDILPLFFINELIGYETGVECEQG